MISPQSKETMILSMIDGIGPQTIKALFREFPSIEAIRSADEQRLKQVLKGRNVKTVLERLRDEGRVQVASRKCDAVIENAKAQDIHILTITDEGYPANLRLINDAPAVLYVRGNQAIIRHSPSVAVVGTRRPSHDGVQTAKAVSRKFAEFGFVVVSGLAEGIDSAAHSGCLERNGMTVAVLGTSVEDSELYPKQNLELANDILSHNGVLASEIPPGHAAERKNFVKRDRIQSGLSTALFPIESDISGGTMHTVRYALSQGRPILCPEPKDRQRPQARGILKLLEIDKVAIRIDSDEQYPVIAKFLIDLASRLNQVSVSDFDRRRINQELKMMDQLKRRELESRFSNILDVKPIPVTKKKKSAGDQIEIREEMTRQLLKELRDIVKKLEGLEAHKNEETIRQVKSILEGLN